MAISDRIQSIEEHIKESYQELEGIGIDTTGVNKNLENIPKLIDGYWETLPKVTGEGTSITLDNTKEGKMKISLKGNTSQETSILPSGYTQVDYIQSSGTQYIDTGFKPNNNTRTIIDFVDNNNGTGFIFGARTGLSNKAYSFLSQNSVNFRFDYGTNQVGAGSKTVGYRYKVDYNKNVCNVYEVNTGTTRTNTITEGTFNSGYNMYLFNNNTADSLSQYSNIKLYSCKIYDNGTLVRNFIPCYRNSDNEVGLYDLVNNVFYTNERIGAFTYGAVATLPNPDYPQDIHVVSGDNTIKITGEQLFELEYILAPNDNNKNAHLKAGTYTLATCDGNGFGTNVYYKLFDKNNNAITESGHLTCSNAQINFSTSSYNYYGGASVSFMTITIDNDYTIAIGLLNSDSTRKVMLVKGSSAVRTYTPYVSQSYPVNLGNIELCKIGTYQDKIYKDNGKWYLNKQIGKYTITGQESDSQYYWSSEINGIRFVLDDAIKTVANAPTYCNRFNQWYSGTTANDYVRLNRTTASSYIGFWFGNITIEGVNSISTFKSYVTNNQVLLYYPLETPTYTEITDSTLISQLEAINGAKSYNPQTNVSQENNNNASILNASALSE